MKEFDPSRRRLLRNGLILAGNATVVGIPLLEEIRLYRPFRKYSPETYKEQNKEFQEFHNDHILIRQSSIKGVLDLFYSDHGAWRMYNNIVVEVAAQPLLLSHNRSSELEQIQIYGERLSENDREIRARYHYEPMEFGRYKSHFYLDIRIPQDETAIDFTLHAKRGSLPITQFTIANCAGFIEGVTDVDSGYRYNVQNYLPSAGDQSFRAGRFVKNVAKAHNTVVFRNGTSNILQFQRVQDPKICELDLESRYDSWIKDVSWLPDIRVPNHPWFETVRYRVTAQALGWENFLRCGYKLV